MSKSSDGGLALVLVVAGASLLSVLSPVLGDDVESSRLSWKKSYKIASDESGRRRRPILVKITAAWCGPCRQMQQLTFADEHVQRRLQKDFVLLEVDADESPDLVSGFHVEALPTTLIVSTDLKILKRLTGFQSPSDLVTALELVKRMPFDSDDLNDMTFGDPDSTEAVSALVPENNVSLGFEGFCLVSLLDENKLRRGILAFTAKQRGQTVSFFSEEHLQRFLATPDRYWPMANGKCLVSSKDRRRHELGDPRVGVIWRDKLWFFSDRETQQRFLAMPQQDSGEL